MFGMNYNNGCLAHPFDKDINLGKIIFLSLKHLLMSFVKNSFESIPAPIIW